MSCIYTTFPNSGVQKKKIFTCVLDAPCLHVYERSKILM